MRPRSVGSASLRGRAMVTGLSDDTVTAVQGAPGNFRVVVIGAGMAGILAAIKLAEAGISDVTVYEKASELGGTWRENTYPGISCDVPSHLYSYTFEPNASWSHVFSPGEEIRGYLERIAREHNVLGRIRFNEEVRSAHFDDGRWHLTTSSGHRDVANVVIAATGVLHHPNIPAFEGIETFGGTTFHSARWDHSVPLEGRRIGVIGTGSTAIQITCALVDQVGHYALFQRTPQWVVPVSNRAYSDEELAAFSSDPENVREQREHLSRFFEEGFANAVVDPDAPPLLAIQRTCNENLDTVRDPELPRALATRLPGGMQTSRGLRRVLRGNPAAERGTRHRGDRADRARGGAHRRRGLHPLDVLVLATGFRVDRFMRPMDLVGRGGITLEETWSPRPSAYLSVSIPEFPNLFMLNGPNGPVGNFSLIEVAEIQMRYLMVLIERLRSGEWREISASAVATTTHEEDRTEAGRHTVWSTGCRSWYLDDRGVPAAWPWTFQRFREVMARPDLDAYELVAT